MKERFSKRPVSPSVNEDVYVSIDVTGKTHRLHVGEHGVTREWIQRLRRMDRRDRDSNRKYYSKSDGRRFTRILYSLDELSWDEMERTPFLIDEDSDVEQLFIMHSPTFCLCNYPSPYKSEYWRKWGHLIIF